MNSRQREEDTNAENFGAEPIGFRDIASDRRTGEAVPECQFEDGGGILPIHNVGVSVTGLIPSGGLGLHYVAEVGNGRASLNSQVEAVQNNADEDNGKSFNLALFARPAAIRGLHAGVSVHHDGLEPAGLPNINETIVAAHAVLIRPSFEWLNEALLIRHAEQGNAAVFNTPGFYTQVSRRFGSYRPYFRYQYVNASDMEPIFPRRVRVMHLPKDGAAAAIGEL